MTSPLELFFKMGDKVSGGDPIRQLDFTYYMMWIMLGAFVMMFSSNVYHLFITPSAQYAIWTLIGFAASGLNFITLKGIYDQRKFLRDNKPSEEKVEPMYVETIEEMIGSFETKSEEDKNVQNGKKEKGRKGDY